MEKVINILKARTVMVQEDQLNEREKELLTVIGRNPDAPLRELLNYTKYKRVNSILRKIEQFKEQNLLWGPVYKVDFGKLCRNFVRRLFCIIELGESYEEVVEYLRLIEPLVWVYPVLSSRREFISAGFYSSDSEEAKALLQLLKDWNIITDFTVHVVSQRTVRETPNFFGDPLPSLDNLFDPCTFPDISYGHHDIEWNECDITILSYLHGGFKDTKLIEILRKEMREHNKSWTYNQIKYSYEKIYKKGLLKKMYYVHPYPLDLCADFFLFLKTEDMDLTQRILYNFARGERLYREYTIFDDWGLIGFICYPTFVVGLMHKLDQVEEITEKELYHSRSFPPGMSYVGEHAEFKYYDIEMQTLEYPYHTFRERIKEKLESE